MSASVEDVLERKAWSSQVARAARAGYQLWRSDPDDGVQRFFVARWDLVRALANVDDVERFLQQAGA